MTPCPFCGYVDYLTLEIKNDSYRVVCDINSGGCGGSSGWKDSAVSAFDAWNTRLYGHVLSPYEHTLRRLAILGKLETPRDNY